VKSEKAKVKPARVAVLFRLLAELNGFMMNDSEKAKVKSEKYPERHFLLCVHIFK